MLSNAPVSQKPIPESNDSDSSESELRKIFPIYMSAPDSADPTLELLQEICNFGTHNQFDVIISILALKDENNELLQFTKKAQRYLADIIKTFSPEDVACQYQKLHELYHHTSNYTSPDDLPSDQLQTIVKDIFNRLTNFLSQTQWEAISENPIYRNLSFELGKLSISNKQTKHLPDMYMLNHLLGNLIVMLQDRGGAASVKCKIFIILKQFAEQFCNNNDYLSEKFLQQIEVVASQHRISFWGGPTKSLKMFKTFITVNQFSFKALDPAIRQQLRKDLFTAHTVRDIKHITKLHLGLIEKAEPDLNDGIEMKQHY